MVSKKLATAMLFGVASLLFTGFCISATAANPDTASREREKAAEKYVTQKIQVWQDRLVRSVRPDIAGRSGMAAASLDIWVTPPEYTGLAPQFLRPGTVETLGIPTGSKLLAQVHGGQAAPRLTIDGESRD